MRQFQSLPKINVLSKKNFKNIKNFQSFFLHLPIFLSFFFFFFLFFFFLLHGQVFLMIMAFIVHLNDFSTSYRGFDSKLWRV